MSLALLVRVQVRQRWTFINAYSGDHLRKSTTTISPSSRKSGIKPKRWKNLNIGQKVGKGYVNTVFPGLNSKLFSETSRGLNRLEYREPDPDFYTNLAEKRDEMGKQIKFYKRNRRDPYNRGYSGGQPLGEKLGPPDPVGDETFEGFETVLLDRKIITNMKSKGRVRKMAVLVATGNGNGLLGYGYVKGQIGANAQKAAVNRAGKRLSFIELFEGRTIYQDFYAECNRSKLWVRRLPKDSGLLCHHVIRDLCKLCGIKDLHVKVEGGTRNYLAISKAFLTGLRNQETLQQLAERKRLHVVEFSSSEGYVPKIVASPTLSPVRTDKDLEQDENSDVSLQILDVEELYSQGRHPFKHPGKKPFFWGTEGFVKARWVEYPWRNREDVSVRMIADGLVSRWSVDERKKWAAEEHERVMNGKKSMPAGYGLPHLDRPDEDEVD